MGVTWITYKTRSTQIADPPTTEQAIQIFEERVLGWQLYPARHMLVGDSSQGISGIPHSGFASLSVMLSYFEMIHEYKMGKRSDGKSKAFFKAGVHDVFPSIDPSNPGSALVLDQLYSHLRCGLYHSAAARRGVLISDDETYPLAYDFDHSTLHINPHMLVDILINHCKEYVAGLRVGGPDLGNFLNRSKLS
ncbi:MAG: hypothetical protein ABSH28_07415 [Acidobacteriota bacterium]